MGRPARPAAPGSRHAARTRATSVKTAVLFQDPHTLPTNLVAHQLVLAHQNKTGLAGVTEAFFGLSPRALADFRRSRPGSSWKRLRRCPMMAPSPNSEYETDDRNFAALLRALGIAQTGKRVVPTTDPERPRFYFKFGQREECERIKDASLIGQVTVNYQKFIAEQNAVMDRKSSSTKSATGASRPVAESSRPSWRRERPCRPKCPGKSIHSLKKTRRLLRDHASWKFCRMALSRPAGLSLPRTTFGHLTRRVVGSSTSTSLPPGS